MTATTLVAKDKALRCCELITKSSQERDSILEKNAGRSALMFLLVRVLAIEIRLLFSIKVRIAIQTAIIDLGTP